MPLALSTELQVPSAWYSYYNTQGRLHVAPPHQQLSPMTTTTTTTYALWPDGYFCDIEDLSSNSHRSDDYLLLELPANHTLIEVPDNEEPSTEN